MDKLLRPRTIALVGASANPSKLSNVVLRNLSQGSFELYPVNPKAEEILGLRCYPDVASVPVEVDLAVVALPARSAVRAAGECVREGVGVVIVTSSGFAEGGPDGKALQEELRLLFKGTGSRLLGPNTMGVFVPSLGLDTLFISSDRSRRPPAGSVALVSQSGAVAVAFLEKAEKTGMGVSSCVCIGNKADIDEVDMMEHLTSDDGTGCVAMYLESFSDGARFLKAASGLSRAKPLVILKSGRTKSGAKAAGSHTGAIASSSDHLVDGVMRQAGAVRAYDEEELVDLSKALSYIGRVRGDRVCVVASAGGFGVIAADYVESEEHGYGLRMAELSEGTRETLASITPSFSSVRNPVDLTAEVTDDVYEKALEALQSDPGVDCVVMSLELQPPNVTEGLIEVAARRSKDGAVPIVVSAFGGERTHDLLMRLEELRVPSYPTIRRAVRATAALVERGRYEARQKESDSGDRF